MSVTVYEPGQSDTPDNHTPATVTDKAQQSSNNADAFVEPQQPDLPDDYWENRCCT